MGRFARTALASGTLFGLLFGLVFGVPFFAGARLITGGWPSPLWLAALVVPAGAVFGALLAAFSETQRHRFAHDPPDLGARERVIKEGPANHFSGREAVGGWLYLTSERLLLRSHEYNLRPHELSLPLDEVLDLLPSGTLGLIPNGLVVLTSSGRERFVLGDRREWRERTLRARRCQKREGLNTTEEKK